MTEGKLKNAPLVEAIFEVKWNLDLQPSGMRSDPNFKLLYGRIYDRLTPKEYPSYEPLPTSSMPEEMAAYVIQYRFRKADNEWPLIQLGPGIITLNETKNYDWPDYQRRIASMVTTFFEAYPKSSTLKIDELNIRYIDAVDFNFKDNDLIQYLHEKMKIDIKMPPTLFSNETGVANHPNGFDYRISYPCRGGIAGIRIVRGQRANRDAIITETTVQIRGKTTPQTSDEILKWVENSHTLVHIWFVKLYKELMESFK